MKTFLETEEFSVLLNRFVTAEFLRGVREKYHYDEAAETDLVKVARRMCQYMRQEAAFEQLDSRQLTSKQLDSERQIQMQSDLQPSVPLQENCRKTAVVMTLGAGVDALQEEYAAKGLLSECYMIEALSSELLLQGYAAYNRWVRRHNSFHVARYYFLGSDEEHPIEHLPEILRRTQLPVVCNEGFCMLPRKSVAFYVQFTREEGVVCEGICVDCVSQQCPNRMNEKQFSQTQQTDMTDRPLPYGYARILGRRFL